MRNLIHNAVVGLAVSFVALSLGAAFGILSGRGAFAGMLSAGVIAVITSMLGGTRVQCSGPTAPMSVVAAVVISVAYDKLSSQLPSVNPEHFVNAVFLMSGFLLVIMAILRIGRFITVVPNVVVSGFMNGIAVLIWIAQTKKLFGYFLFKILNKKGSSIRSILLNIISDSFSFMDSRSRTFDVTSS